MNNWKEYKLGDVATIVDCEHKTAPLVEYSDFISVRTSDISGGKIDFDKCNRISFETYEGWTKRLQPKEGDIILAREAPVGEVGLVTKNKKVCLGQRTVLIRVDDRLINNDYLLYYLVNPVVKNDLISRSTGSVVEHLNVKDIKNFDLKVHSEIKEQIIVADLLSSIDNKIDLLHRQNKTLEQLAETLFRQWFVEDKWEGSLSEYVKVQGGYAFKSKDFKEVGFAGVIKITNISMEFVDIEKSDFVDENVIKNLDKRFKIKSGDFLIAMTGAEIGKIGIVEKTEKELWVNQRVGKLETKVPYGNIIGYLALKSVEGQDHIINACSGSAQENISTTGIEEMVFAKYDYEKANSFGEQAQPFFDKIIFNLNQIRTLTQLRDTLLPKLMSGEVRVEMN
ncbi:MAG: restriction endonuclease subunit S [Chitinophagales bacterium]|jgi:type I restriction enzyme S subunit|nr:restriction endonuclease subunit S [Chitinophagales bacterium]